LIDRRHSVVKATVASHLRERITTIDGRYIPNNLDVIAALTPPQLPR
jgi:hypothetical protein